MSPRRPTQLPASAAMASSVSAGSIADRIGLIAGPVAVIALIWWLSSFTGSEATSAAFPALETLLQSAPIVILWLAAAIGYGWPLRALLAPRSNASVSLQIASGIAGMLWLDMILGIAGTLFLGQSAIAWLVIAVGVGLLVVQCGMRLRSSSEVPIRIAWPWWLAAPAIATLLLATTSAPGWLWASEFGGYDALSYHLQLPREWMLHGRIVPLEHNVYSFLPGYAEAAFTHLTILRGDVYHAAYSAQLLHACMAVLAAVLIARTMQTFMLRSVPVLAIGAGVMFLALPWTVVVGSLAYNEMFVCVMFAGGLLVITDYNRTPNWRTGALIGLFAGAACGAKLTASGFVALPLVVVLMMQFASQRRVLISMLIAGAIAGLVMLAPWLVRNWMATGNPTFPFLTNIFGNAHWTAEQLASWRTGHSSSLSLGGRLAEGFNQLLSYGIGRNPDATGHEPWIAQWLILPWLGFAGCAAGFFSQRTRRLSINLLVIITLQCIFWLSVTHIQSRFMLPFAVSACLAMGVGVAAILFRFRDLRYQLTQYQRPIYICVFLLLLAWSTAIIVIYQNEQHGRPALFTAAHQVYTGDDITTAERALIGSDVPASVYINQRLSEFAHVLLVGEATPYYYDLRRVDYHTTWDRGPMSTATQRHPAEPTRWFAFLRDAGYTHLLINGTMLQLWHDAGWCDPNLRPALLIAVADEHAILIATFPGNLRLYQLD